MDNLLDRWSLGRVGAVCIVLYVVAVCAVLVLLAATGLLDAFDAEDVLPIMHEERTGVLAAGWLLVLAPVLLAIGGLAIYAALRDEHSLMQVALLGFVVGSFLALIRNVIWMGMTFELAPAYAQATPADQSSLAAFADTLLMFGFIIGDVTGGVLVAGVAIPMFSLALLRSKLTPAWVAWMGFFIAVFAGWFPVLGAAWEVLMNLSAVGFIPFAVWLLVLAWALWRHPTNSQVEADEPSTAGLAKAIASG